MNVTTIRRYDA